jgi:hypothetical protein
MPTMDRQVKVAKEAIDAVADGSEDKTAVLAALKDIQEHLEYAIDDNTEDEDTDD